MELFKLLGTIAIDNQEANKQIDGTTEKAGKSESKISAAFKKIGTAVATYIAVDKIVDFGKACVNAAADANAAASQFTQVFGELEDDASKNLSAIAKNAGIMETRMKGSYTKIAAFAKTTGMETADALALADRAMIAVADSAAFYDRSLEDTTESLQSFLKGNFENDAALGLSCTEVTRNAAAVKLFGLEYKELSEQQKQLTLLQMVEDANKLSGAIGQAARESDTWTNQTGNLQQAWTDFKAVIGENFLEPAIGSVKRTTAVVQELATKVPVVVEWFKQMYEKAKSYFPAIQEEFQKAWGIVKTVWDSIGQPIFDMVMLAVDTLLAVVAEKMPEIREFVAQCFTDIQVFWEENLKPCLEAIKKFLTEVLAPIFKTVFVDNIAGFVDKAFKYIIALWNETLKPVLVGITDFITGVFTGNWRLAFNGIVNIVSGAFSGIVNTAKSAVNQIAGFVNSIISLINSVQIPDWVPLIGGGSLSIPQIPQMAEGGVLKKGEIGLLEGNGAEAVVPLDRNRAWVSAVAKDMDSSMGGKETVGVLNKILDAISKTNDELEEVKDSFASMKVEMNNREFGRLVKAVN